MTLKKEEEKKRSIHPIRIDNNDDDENDMMTLWWYRIVKVSCPSLFSDESLWIYIHTYIVYFIIKVRIHPIKYQT